ncbi:MAG: hypothetical protein IPK85_02770 [Gemmatimonadetes bacterium]|nr:hypothetical protein [Gemmatimonadota bacterium]
MKCWCGSKATHYVSIIIGRKGQDTDHIDNYLCDDHTERVEAAADRDKDVMEFEAKEL